MSMRKMANALPANPAYAVVGVLLGPVVQGSVVRHDARATFGLKELQTVVIRGTAERDDAGNLTVLATGMFVKN